MRESAIGERFFNSLWCNIIVAIVSWRLVYAFVEKEECSKEEKTFG
jgi:hypothetical protein